MSSQSIPATAVDRTTFGKWDAETDRALGHPGEIVLAGVTTDCCVLSTALAAADAGVHVIVAADACAGLTEADHQRALDAMALYSPLIDIAEADTHPRVSGQMITPSDRARGALYGLAIGDALGMPTQLMSHRRGRGLLRCP